MVWLVINGSGSLYGSQDDGLKALTAALTHRRGLGCTITPGGAPAFGVEYRAQHPSNGFELIYLTDEEPAPAED